ncbi:MAG: iron-containing alcohol dehydrogenase, partial [Acutalibacteraceae bacterium]
MDFNLNLLVKVISGKNCVLQNSTLFRSFGNKCLIVTGANSAKKSGALGDIKKALEKEQISFEIFDEIGPNPLLSLCHKAGEKARSFGADFIVGIGGGSALDAAKAVAVFAANESFSPNDIYAAKSRNRALKIVLIGTTAGTGSEVGKVAVLTNDETGRKKSISPDDCFPALTFADSSYTCSMPFEVTVSTALDALCHALEGYFSKKCTDIPTLFAEKGVPMIWKGLKELHKTKTVPDAALREALYYGSLYAGITLSYCGTAFPHPLGYVLTENYGVPHGTACAAFMRDFIDRAEKYENEKLKRILSLTGESKNSFLKVVEDLTFLPEIKMCETEIENYCSRWNESIPNNFIYSPGGFSKE